MFKFAHISVSNVTHNIPSSMSTTLGYCLYVYSVYEHKWRADAKYEEEGKNIRVLSPWTQVASGRKIYPCARQVAIDLLALPPPSRRMRQEAYRGNISGASTPRCCPCIPCSLKYGEISLCNPTFSLFERDPLYNDQEIFLISHGETISRSCWAPFQWSRPGSNPVSFCLWVYRYTK
jgi:hypothetical protein